MVVVFMSGWTCETIRKRCSFICFIDTHEIWHTWIFKIRHYIQYDKDFNVTGLSMKGIVCWRCGLVRGDNSSVWKSTGDCGQWGDNKGNLFYINKSQLILQHRCWMSSVRIDFVILPVLQILKKQIKRWRNIVKTTLISLF